MKESSNKELVRSTWAGHVEKMGYEIYAENRCPESGGEMEAMKTEFAMGDCNKNDVDRVGDEWGK